MYGHPKNFLGLRALCIFTVYIPDKTVNLCSSSNCSSIYKVYAIYAPQWHGIVHRFSSNPPSSTFRYHRGRRGFGSLDYIGLVRGGPGELCPPNRPLKKIGNGTQNLAQMMPNVAPDCIWGYLNFQKFLKGEAPSPRPAIRPCSWLPPYKNYGYTSAGLTVRESPRSDKSWPPPLPPLKTLWGTLGSSIKKHHLAGKNGDDESTLPPHTKNLATPLWTAMGHSVSIQQMVPRWPSLILMIFPHNVAA